MAVVIGEFDVVEIPSDPGQPAAPPVTAPAPPLSAPDLDRLAAQQWQRELRCFAD